MKISLQKLVAEAQTTGFRPEILEKVAHLLLLLNAIQSHPFLKGKLALKGGTALNLFVLEIPRLSVDIDLNYIGAEDKETMLAERPKLEQTIQAAFERSGFTVRRIPDGHDHAGGKWSLRYESALGQTGNLEVDLNFMFRVPLWPIVARDSLEIGVWRATEIPMLNYHELAAGKLAALLSRRQARDLFDSHRILQMDNLDSELLRIGFVVYGAMNRKDWRTVSVNDVNFGATELTSQLTPTLRRHTAGAKAASLEFGKRLVDECRDRLSVLLPLRDTEREFLDLLLDKGVIEPSSLTSDEGLQRAIQRQPLLE